MEEYTRWTAKNFSGIRIDNCHSTPLNVAEHLLTIARQEKPEIVIIAELFVPYPTDNHYVSRLGIDYLIRESMNPGSPDSFAGMLKNDCVDKTGAVWSNLTQSVRPKSLLVDASHDNPSLVEKRTIQDFLPNAALG